MQQVILQCAHMPLHVALLSNGLIAFIPSGNFSTMYESCKGYGVCIDSEGIKFVGESLVEPLEIEYNTMVSYRDNPVLKDWLISMQLTNPF